MTTLAHDVCNVHGASAFYVKPVGKVILYIYLYNMNMYNIYIQGFPYWWDEESPPIHQLKIC